MSTYPKDVAFATLAAIVLASLKSKAKTQDFKKKTSNTNNDWLPIKEDNSKPKGKKQRKHSKKTKSRQKVQDDKNNDKACFEKSEEYQEPVIKKDLELQSNFYKKVDKSVEPLEYDDSTTKFFQLLRTLGVSKLENKTVIVVSPISNMKHKNVVFCTLPNGHVLVIPRNFIIKELNRSLWTIGLQISNCNGKNLIKSIEFFGKQWNLDNNGYYFIGGSGKEYSLDAKPTKQESVSAKKGISNPFSALASDSDDD